MEGPDQGWAWAVAFAGLMLNFIVAGLGRMSGIMYVSFIEMFHLDRKEASTPFSVRSSMRNLLGPVVGILGQKYGVQKVILVGSGIATISAAFCFFAHDIFWITFLWGGLGGAGAALTMCIVQVRIGQYFEKYRTTAAGMGFSGGCVGSFLFPALLEIMLLEYGMEGTFLLMSGVIMHCIPAAMIMSEPPWMQKKKVENNKKVITNSTNELVKLEDGVIITRVNDLDGNNTKQYSSNKVLGECPDVQFLQEHNKLVIKLLTLKLPDDNTTNIPQGKNQNNAQPVIETCIQETMEDLYYKQRHSCHKNQLNQNSKLSKNNILHDILQRNDIKYICSQKSRSFHLGKRLRLGSIPKTCSVPDITKMTNDISTNYVLLRMREVFSMEITQILSRCPDESKDEVLKVLAELRKLYREHGHFNADNGSYLATCWDIPPTNEKIVNSNEHSKDSNSIWVHVKTAIKLFANPLFVLTCLCRTVHFLTFVPVITTIVDVTIDKGLKQEDGKYVIAALSLGDLIGRLCLGWVTDKGFMSLPRFMLVVMVLQGANSATMPLMETKLAIYLSLGFFGMLQGSLFVRHSVLVLKYLGSHEHSIAMGSINLFSGFLGFVLPLYIGYFRDTLGTYDYIFYINGGICVAIGLLWAFEPYFMHCSRRTTDDESA